MLDCYFVMLVSGDVSECVYIHLSMCMCGVVWCGSPLHLIFMTAVSHAIINFEGFRNCPDVFLYSSSSLTLLFVQLKSTIERRVERERRKEKTQ